MTVAIPLLTLLVMLLMGVPVAWSMMTAGLLGLALISDFNGTMLSGTLQTIVFQQSTNYTMLAVPLFILLAFLLSNAGLSDDLFNAVSKLTGQVRGGLGTGTVTASAMFGAMSGASVASATVMSKVAMPAMRKARYSESLATGSIAIGSTLSTLIPPSIVLIIYGMATETSIGRLLVAGLIPAFMIAILAIATVLLWAWTRKGDAPAAEPATSREKLASLPPTIPALFLMASICVLLYSGIASPTEVAAAGALLALVLVVLMGRLTWGRFRRSLRSALDASIMIFALLIGAAFFSRYMTMARIPHDILSWVESLGLSPTGIIIAVAIACVIGCMFMDETPFLLLTLPVTFPLVTAAGFDPVWFGVFSVLLLNIGLISPPVGMLSFIISGAAKVPIAKVYLGASIMIIPILIGIVAITIWPAIVLWLPNSLN